MRSSRYHGSFTAGAMPGTLQRSCPEAQAVFLKAREEAVRVHGATDEALRVAYAALKQDFEKCGDHCVAKTRSAA